MVKKKRRRKNEDIAALQKRIREHKERIKMPGQPEHRTKYWKREIEKFKREIRKKMRIFL